MFDKHFIFIYKKKTLQHSKLSLLPRHLCLLFEILGMERGNVLLCWKQTEERNFKYSKFKTHIFPRLQNIFNWGHVNRDVKITFFIFSPQKNVIIFHNLNGIET